MSMTKRFIEDQKTMGNDVLNPSFEDETLDAQYKNWLKTEGNMSNCCGAKMFGADHGIPTGFCSDCMDNAVTLSEEIYYS